MSLVMSPVTKVSFFNKWEFGAGVYHSGEKAGKGIKINHKMVGIFTVNMIWIYSDLDDLNTHLHTCLTN